MKERQVKFLVVEDNDLDVEKIERAFKRLRITNPLVRAKDGIEALDTLRGGNGRAPLERPFIVLLDLNMPKMNGIEFLQELRQDQHLADTSVFVFTTSDHKRDVLAAHQHNISGYIVKPLTRAQMSEALDTLNIYWNLCEFPEDGRQ